ncbi:RtcB family protein [Pseudomonas japonica]|uniref:RtcB family protein n=1 Tax=Pseudomonas japonica TaxID=256466 RepID=UPI0015E3729F|nr:RtcB family protein [Pseudomonas japonica]MBA1290982.1 RtcB family protein [Pseudomonas japonica]
MTAQHYDLLKGPEGSPIKMWTQGVPVDPAAKQQLLNTARMPFIFKHMAVMPDVHLGKGSTIGSVIPTKGAVIPAAVGVDLGCGMSAVRTSLSAADLPDNLAGLRTAIEKAVPHGRTMGRGRDKGSWDAAPKQVDHAWAALKGRFDAIAAKHPVLKKTNNHKHLGTLGTGNHFVEVCLDEASHVWFMLHTGSRGVGNAIGSYFIEKARDEMRAHMINLPDRDLAYLKEGTRSFDDYVEAVEWAQDYARQNRAVMMLAVLDAARSIIRKPFEARLIAVDCHHNYIERGTYFGEDILLTRKGAVSAQKGQMGIIPGSMGAKSFIVRGLGNEEAFCSCSHGAGRVMSRTQAKARFTVADQVKATQGVECRKDEAVIDEIPMAYKDIEKVMEAQRDLVEVVHTLRQVVCVKG